MLILSTGGTAFLEAQRSGWGLAASVGMAIAVCAFPLAWAIGKGIVTGEAFKEDE